MIQGNDEPTTATWSLNKVFFTLNSVLFSWFRFQKCIFVDLDFQLFNGLIDSCRCLLEAGTNWFDLNEWSSTGWFACCWECASTH